MQLAHALKDALDEPGDPLDRRRRADEFSFDVRVPTYEALIRKILHEHGVVAEAPAPVIMPEVISDAGPFTREVV